MTDYVKKAENVVEQTMQKDRLTITQIRKFLAGVNMISNRIIAYQAQGKIKDDILPDDIVNEIQYLKVKFIYQCGRQKQVKKFNDIAKITNEIDQIKNSKSNFERFSRYVEAIVAYHKYKGGE